MSSILVRSYLLLRRYEKFILISITQSVKEIFNKTFGGNTGNDQVIIRRVFALSKCTKHIIKDEEIFQNDKRLQHKRPRV